MLKYRLHEVTVGGVAPQVLPVAELLRRVIDSGENHLPVIEGAEPVGDIPAEGKIPGVDADVVPEAVLAAVVVVVGAAAAVPGGAVAGCAVAHDDVAVGVHPPGQVVEVDPVVAHGEIAEIIVSVVIPAGGASSSGDVDHAGVVGLRVAAPYHVVFHDALVVAGVKDGRVLDIVVGDHVAHSVCTVDAEPVVRVYHRAVLYEVVRRDEVFPVAAADACG